MHLNKNVVFAALTLSILVAMVAPRIASSDELPSQEIIDAANAGMKAFLKFESESRRTDGVNSNDAGDNAELGDAIEIFTIPPKNLVPEYRRSCPPFYPDIESLITPMNRWLFSIRLDGKVANKMVEVSLRKDKWETHTFIASSFPQLLHDLLTAWPRDSGYRLRLVRLFYMNATLFEVSRQGKLVGLLTQNSEFKKLLQPSQILPDLCEGLARNMEEDERARAKGEVLFR